MTTRLSSLKVLRPEDLELALRLFRDDSLMATREVRRKQYFVAPRAPEDEGHSCSKARRPRSPQEVRLASFDAHAITPYREHPASRYRIAR
jgi:hypothetical protein